MLTLSTRRDDSKYECRRACDTTLPLTHLTATAFTAAPHTSLRMRQKNLGVPPASRLMESRRRASVRAVVRCLNGLLLTAVASGVAEDSAGCSLAPTSSGRPLRMLESCSDVVSGYRMWEVHSVNPLETSSGKFTVRTL